MLLTFGLLNFSEAMIYNVMSIYGWNCVNALDEDFISMFIFLFNFGFTILTQFSRWMMGSMKNEFYGLLIGNEYIFDNF